MILIFFFLRFCVLTGYLRLLSSHSSLHNAPVTALACAEDGQLLLTGAADGTCRLWGVVNVQRGGGGQVCHALQCFTPRCQI